MIQASGLTKFFGTARALDNINFEVSRGEVVGFLGPNGAGKSTTMRILTCFLAPTSGTARVHGTDVFEDPLGVRRKIGYLPQRAPLYTDMNVWEYLEFVAQIRGVDPTTFRTRLKKVVEVCGLAQVLGKDIGALSHGYRQRVGLGQALIHDPPILILDEPTADLDPNEKAEVIRYIREIGKDRTILLSTHNLGEVEQACARAIIVSKGRVVADGGLDDIRGKTGAVRYFLAVAAGNDGPKGAEVRAALDGVPGATRVRELDAEDGELKLEVSGASDSDLRAELFRCAVQKGWTLLELRRDAQSLDAVFRDLTRGDEKLDRGDSWQDDAGDDADGTSNEAKS
ncbi:MAG: ATP-binding cassette domain-containing protein [Deltaproteobacteria bacterium]|nr:ATP-binding cassette domain-containing protein [Deltaproteobacteria bacterium]